MLQAPRVLIEGAVGVGYVMRAGFDLPPINFDVEEAEAITVDLAMITLTGDKGLKRAAQKLADGTPAQQHAVCFKLGHARNHPASICPMCAKPFAKSRKLI